MIRLFIFIKNITITFWKYLSDKERNNHYKIFPKSNTSIAKDFKIGRYYNLQCYQWNYLKIESGVVFREFCNILLMEKANLIIGKNVFFNNYCSINCLEKIEIGNNTLFGEGVKIYDHNHKYETVNNDLKIERNKFTTASIIIGSNCWIGSNVTILKGVEIGDNVIIGSGCLVYKSIPSNTIVKSSSSVEL